MGVVAKTPPLPYGSNPRGVLTNVWQHDKLYYIIIYMM